MTEGFVAAAVYVSGLWIYLGWLLLRHAHLGFGSYCFIFVDTDIIGIRLFFGGIGNKWIEDFFYQMLICGFQNRVFKTLYFKTPYLNGLLIFSAF